MAARTPAAFAELRAKAKALRPYAFTEAQDTVIESLSRTGSVTDTAREIGRDRSCVNKTLQRVARSAVVHGHAPEHDRDHPIPAPEQLRGHSILYGRDGAKTLHWVKTRVDLQEAWAAIRATAEELTHDVKGVAKPVRQIREMCRHTVSAQLVEQAEVKNEQS